MERIDIKVFTLPGSSITKVSKCYIELSSDRLAYVHDYHVDIPADEENDSEEYRVLDKVVYKKNCMVGASLSSRIIDTEDAEGDVTIYAVTLPIAYVDEAIEVALETIREANAFHKKMCDYIFS